MIPALDLSEYELADELRKLPIRDARKLARAAATAVDEPVTAETLDLLTKDQWHDLALGVGEPTAKLAIHAMLKYGQVSVLDAVDDTDLVLDELEPDNVIDVLRRMLDSDDIDEVSDKLPDDVREALKAMGDDEAQAVKALTPTKLFFVYQSLPREKREKKRRVFRYVAQAAGPAEAVEAVRRDRPKMIHECDWRAEEAGEVAAIDWSLEP